MSKPAIDIIVPVWNRPVETRECLVNLMAHSPDARLILVNNGSERETESLLEEFAGILDERALLITTPTNLGFVKAVNRGLARTEAEYTAIVRNGTNVSEGWLDPLLNLARTRPEAGVIVPRLVMAIEKGPQSAAGSVSVTETDHGDFAAMLVRKELYDRVGGFDEELDGGNWCLKDYSRRALKEGFLTFAAEDGPVVCRDEPPLGSVARREEILRRSMAAYITRWGEERAFCIHFPKEASIDSVRDKLDTMLVGARQGHFFAVLIHPATFRELIRNGCGTLHRNIRLEQLPRFFADGRARSLAASLRELTSGIVSIEGCEGIPFPGDEKSIPFAELERMIESVQREKYRS